MANQIGLLDFVCNGVSNHIKKLATARCVDPHFHVPPARIFAEIQVVTPVFIAAGVGVRWSCDVSLAAVMEFFFFSGFLTVGAVNLQHLKSPARPLVCNAGRSVLVDQCT